MTSSNSKDCQKHLKIIISQTFKLIKLITYNNETNACNYMDPNLKSVSPSLLINLVEE